jgi:sugar phosphate isomerase/epimerase
MSPSCESRSTGLVTASDPAARPILATAARLRIPFFKLGYFKWGKDVRRTSAFRSALKRLPKCKHLCVVCWISHAFVEGAVNGWEMMLKLASPRLQMVATKDFNWAKTSGTWRTQSCPLGEGAVDWPKAFSVLAECKFAGPLSIHQEYKAADRLAAAHKDLEFVMRQIDKAYV